MREFAIFDNNGYLLQFGAPIDAPAEDGEPSTAADRDPPPVTGESQAS